MISHLLFLSKLINLSKSTLDNLYDYSHNQKEQICNQKRHKCRFKENLPNPREFSLLCYLISIPLILQRSSGYWDELFIKEFVILTAHNLYNEVQICCVKSDYVYGPTFVIIGKTILHNICLYSSRMQTN